MTCEQLEIALAQNQAARDSKLAEIATLTSQMSLIQLDLVGSDPGHPAVPFTLSSVNARISSIYAEMAGPPPLSGPDYALRSGWLTQYNNWKGKYDQKQAKLAEYYDLEATWVDLNDQWVTQECE